MILKIRNLSHDYTGMIPLNWSNYKKENTYTKLPSLLQDSAGLPIEESLVVVASVSLCDTLTRCCIVSSVPLSECHGAALITCCPGHCLVSTAQCPVLPWTGPSGGTSPGTDIAHRQPGHTAPVALVGWSLPSISHKHCPHVILKIIWKICIASIV